MRKFETDEKAWSSVVRTARVDARRGERVSRRPCSRGPVRRPRHRNTLPNKPMTGNSREVADSAVLILLTQGPRSCCSLTGRCRTGSTRATDGASVAAALTAFSSVRVPPACRRSGATKRAPEPDVTVASRIAAMAVDRADRTHASQSAPTRMNSSKEATPAQHTCWPTLVISVRCLKGRHSTASGVP
jgi:hypothetical protein